MAEKKYIKVNSVTNEDGSLLFGAICDKVLNVSQKDAKELIGIPKAEPAAMQDVITLLQNSIVDGEDISVEIIVRYEPKLTIEQEFDIKKK